MLGKRGNFPENDDIQDKPAKKLKNDEEKDEEPDSSDIEEYIQTFNPEDYVIEDDGKLLHSYFS